MNVSRNELPHIRSRQVNSGAYGPLAKLTMKEGPLQIVGMARDKRVDRAGKTVLVLDKPKSTENGWPVITPLAYVLVPGTHQLGEIIEVFPFGSELLNLKKTALNCK